jgi:hypothetical protein
LSEEALESDLGLVLGLDFVFFGLSSSEESSEEFKNLFFLAGFSSFLGGFLPSSELLEIGVLFTCCPKTVLIMFLISDE